MQCDYKKSLKKFSYSLMYYIADERLTCNIYDKITTKYMRN